MSNFDQFHSMVFVDENNNKHYVGVDDFDAFDKAMSNKSWHLVFGELEKD